MAPINLLSIPPAKPAERPVSASISSKRFGSNILLFSSLRLCLGLAYIRLRKPLEASSHEARFRVKASRCPNVVFFPNAMPRVNSVVQKHQTIE